MGPRRLLCVGYLDSAVQLLFSEVFSSFRFVFMSDIEWVDAPDWFSGGHWPQEGSVLALNELARLHARWLRLKNIDSALEQKARLGQLEDDLYLRFEEMFIRFLYLKAGLSYPRDLLVTDGSVKVPIIVRSKAPQARKRIGTPLVSPRTSPHTGLSPAFSDLSLPPLLSSSEPFLSFSDLPPLPEHSSIQVPMQRADIGMEEAPQGPLPPLPAVSASSASSDLLASLGVSTGSVSELTRDEKEHLAIYNQWCAAKKNLPASHKKELYTLLPRVDQGTIDRTYPALSWLKRKSLNYSARVAARRLAKRIAYPIRRYVRRYNPRKRTSRFSMARSRFRSRYGRRSYRRRLW